ncbi:S41 family peptidase [Flavobacterium sp.]|jgi:carboxyl-terminal processing protease|uniref:S41 family peptidase n=1 Tax=Flavobacterium sp. TaxID=239 RepID=UPI0037BEBD61
MRVYLKITLALVLFTCVFISCEDKDDIPVPANLEVNDFVWKGLNLYYYWQADSPDLLDTRFSTQSQLNSFLDNYSAPEDLFEHLIVDRTIDRFSVIFDDYDVLQGVLQGTAKNNGVDFGLVYKQGSQTEIFGWVRYILPNSDASSKPIQRGDIFYAVNGTPLTVNNYQQLLSAENYTLNLADFDGGAITPNGESVSLTKTEYSENPVYYTNVYTYGDKKIGYLVYNGFFSGFDSQLNQAFNSFSAQGVTHLIVDLRYNSGGSVNTATYLASMITGQFNGQVFAKQQWNQKVEDFYNENNPELLINRYTNSLGNGTPINSLNLTKVYVITSKSSASASELLINGLNPYIDVVQIGDVTTGKNVGSITVYDSPTFGSQNKNPNHKYAMQPIVLKIVNKDGFGEYQNGLQPSTLLKENLGNLGTLGDVDEPLLSTTIGIITANGRMVRQQPSLQMREFKNVKELRTLGTEMYLDKVPEGFDQLLRK